MTRSNKGVSRDYSSMLTILVGPDKQPFCVHKNFICKRAKFFKASCADGRWLEGKTNTIALPITEPDVFQTYLDWAYTDDSGMSTNGITGKRSTLRTNCSSAFGYSETSSMTRACAAAQCATSSDMYEAGRKLRLSAKLGNPLPRARCSRR